MQVLKAPKQSHGTQSSHNAVRQRPDEVRLHYAAKATKLNRHGAAIQLNRKLLVGSTVVLQNARRTQLSARVVTQVIAQRQGVYTYGVEFLEPDAAEKSFWGINFPPPVIPK
jgi:hypothetical protein